MGKRTNARLDFPIIAPVRVGPHALPNAVLLAPMSGVTDVAFRHVALAWGAGLVITEMVASEHLVTEKHNGDVLKVGGWGNLSSFAPGCIIIGNNDWDTLAANQLPDGRLSPTAVWPRGRDGSVSARAGLAGEPAPVVVRRSSVNPTSLRTRRMRIP